jgi:hypothetical protein
MKDRLQNEYTRRLRRILKSELNGKNRINVTGGLAVPELDTVLVLETKY